MDRRLSEKRIFPAIDINRSGTRHDDLLLNEETVKQVMLLRRMISMITSTGGMDANDATERVLERLGKAKTNADFLANLSKEMAR